MTPLFRMLQPLILASGSPRRHSFLHEAGLKFDVRPPIKPERPARHGEDPAAYALHIASRKAEEILNAYGGGGLSPTPTWVLAADTIVVLGSSLHKTAESGPPPQILGKPADQVQALSMLQALSGRDHEVITACCLASSHGKALSFSETAQVRFGSWPLPVLESYVATGEPMDKAGAYAIQGIGAFLVQGLQGSWSTVVGLPIDRVLCYLLEQKVIEPCSAGMPPA